jgi:PAS domain S-box-containing protein
MLVDDQPAKLLAYETILSDLGENLIRAASGREALEHLLKTDVAVLLVDVNMPETDGFELARIVRQHPRFERTAIIFVSAICLDDVDRLQGYRLGAVDYVTVPVIPEILRAKVGVFIELYRKTQQLEFMNDELEARVEERTVELAASEERFRLATEAMRGGLYDWTLSNNEWWSSFGLADLVGHGHQAKNGVPEWWQSLIHPDDIPRGWSEALSALNKGNLSFGVEYRVRHHDGHWVWVWDRGRIVRNEQGQAVRVVGHITDITSQKNAEDALKEADQRKDEFLATLSHELRNPLAPIRNALSVMRLRGFSSSQLSESWDMIDRQVGHLGRLIDDLLDTTRISLNRMDLQRSQIDLADAVRAAVEASAPLFDQLDHRLTLAVQESVYVDGDLVRLTQVFTNLLNNGAKFTPKGGQIWLSLERDGNHAVVRIKDTGKGIAPQELSQIFRMFYQHSDCPQYSKDGLGIGLSLVSRIVGLHGGTVEADSPGPNEGSEFVVRIPVAEAKAEQQAETIPDPISQTRVIHRILVADDNADSAESLAMLLELQGYEVRIVSDGLEAVRVASEFTPDAILLDIGMPVLDGYGAARRIREQPFAKDVLIIAQTGWGQERDRQRSEEGGFDAHLTKPLNLAVLMKLLGSSSEPKHC